MKRRLLSFGVFLCIVFGLGTSSAQRDDSRFRVVVDLVQLNVAVTDNKGNYITGLSPSDFSIAEDGIPEKLATFGEGNSPVRRVIERAPGEKVTVAEPDPAPAQTADKAPAGSEVQETLSSAVVGANVFILFDTSNYMYRGFVFAQDAISDFVRSLQNADKVAFYSYSRNLSRGAALTADRSVVVHGVRTTVAGDDAALYNALLLTVKDAAKTLGRKVVVVFSNGPDNASMVPPEDVSELAQSSGISIYMISTREAKLEPVSTAVFERLTAATGGKAYFAKNWRDEKLAFASIRDDLGHLYSLSYYPKPNSNRGWRAINVRLVGEALKKYHIRTRDGYRPQPTRIAAGEPAAETSESSSDGSR
jgi:Ca-activated chloride channel family protein